MTVATIARLAGVSPATVSKVLNGRAGVATDTRTRVEELLRDKGYQRPAAITPAASLEVVFYDLESHLAIEILRGVERVAQGYEMAVGFTEIKGRAAGDRSWTDQVLVRRPTGVIAVHSEFTARQQAQLISSAIPVVALDPSGEPTHAIPSVGATNWSGGVAATRHLLDLGHRRIAAISGPAGYLSARARLDGYRAALDAAGVEADPGLIRTGRFWFEDGLALGRELLRLAVPPTAVVCGNDLQALGLYEAARQAGVTIPEELSVVGFDDTEYSRWCGPPMTTVRQPLADMGAAAAELVLSLAAGQVPEQTRLELATTLVVRRSTAEPGRGQGH